MTSTVSLTLVAQLAIAQAAAFASFLLLASGVHKLADRPRAAAAVAALTGLADARARQAALLLAVLELLAGAGLWLPSLRLDAALLALLVWSGYAVFLLQAVVGGQTAIDCGCSFGAGHARLGRFQVLRAGLLALLALIVACSAAVSPGAVAYEVGAAVLATQVLAGFALLALYVALDQLMALTPLRAGMAA